MEQYPIDSYVAGEIYSILSIRETSWFCYIHKKETLHTLRTGHARGTRALFFPVPILLTGTCFADYFDANNN